MFYFILDLFLLYLCVVADGLFITVPSSSAVNTPNQPLPRFPLSCLRQRNRETQLLKYGITAYGARL